MLYLLRMDNRTFKLYWERYAAYCVTKELVGSNARKGYDEGSYKGTVLRAKTKSHFLSLPSLLLASKRATGQLRPASSPNDALGFFARNTATWGRNTAT
jgi:hypothetical protein